MRQRFFFVMLFAFALFSIPRAGRAQEDAFRLLDRLDTVVGDAVITGLQIQLAAERGDDTLRQAYGDKPGDVLEQKRTELRQEIRTNMINSQLVLQEFKSLQKKNPAVKIPETYIDEQIRMEIREKYADDRVAFAKDLRNNGLTLEQYRKRKRDNFIIDVMQNQFVPEPLISPLKVENYYRTNANSYKVPDQVKFRQIVLNRSITDSDGATKKRAEEILSQIKGGASFEEMAKSYSEGSQRSVGGLSDWQDVSVLNNSLRVELGKLKPGEDSGVVETPEAFFILHLEDRRPAHVRPLNEVRDDIEHDLMRQERQRTMDRWYGRLRTKNWIQQF